MNNIPKKHLNGRVFFRFPTNEFFSSDDYFKCLDLLKPLFKKNDFINSTPGFYINYIADNSVPNGTLRFNFFTINASLTIDAIEKFTNENAAKLTIFRWEPDLDKFRSRPLEEYNEGEDETALRFRNTLNTNTQIALDLLENDKQQTFRNSITSSMFSYLLTRASPAIMLEPIFNKYSNFFRDLKKYSLDQEYWNNLVFNFPNGWPLHVLANMLRVPEPQ